MENYPCEKRHTVPITEITEIIWALEIYYNIEFAELKSFGRVWNVLTFLFYVCIRKVRFHAGLQLQISRISHNNSTCIFSKMFNFKKSTGFRFFC